MREAIRYITAENVGFNLAQEAAVTAKMMHDNPAVLEIAARNIRTYEAETLEDHVVSYFPYFRNRYNGENRLFRLPNSTRQEDLVINSIDPQERGGSVVEGFWAFDTDTGRIDTGWFLWISPKGPAGTEGIYKNITFRYHQIYLGTIHKDKIDAYAFKSDIDETTLSEWISAVSAGEKNPDPNSAESFIINPVVSSGSDGEQAVARSLLTLGTLLSAVGKNSFYKDISVDEIFTLMQSQRIKQEAEVKKLQNQITYELSGRSDDSRIAEVLGRQMVALYSRYQDELGNVPLKGCVGGSISINQLFGSGLTQSNEVFSSAYRLNSTGMIDISQTVSESCNKISCKQCNWEANEEEVAKIQEGKLTSCPKCGWSPK